MNCDSYIRTLTDTFMITALLSDKNGSTVYKLLHRRLGNCIILRKNTVPVPAYNILKNFKHNNLPEVYDSLHFDDGQIVLEEYIDGISVAEVLDSGKYTYHGAKTIITEVCLATETLHSFGIVHRDIKPENIIVSNAGAVKLIDLNASRMQDPLKTNDTRVLGTIGYASPEQMGISQTDARSDIYALGVLLNVMLTGEHPSKTMAKGKVGRIIAKCTHIDPNRRYVSVKELIQAL